MRRFLHLALILCLALTGIGLGVARGTVAVGGQMVLCTGAGVVVVNHPDAPGGTAAHVCPDMALSLLSAVASDPPLPQRILIGAVLTQIAYDAALVPHDSLPASARDPPAILI